MYTRITANNSMSTLCLAERPRLTSIALIVDTQTTERYTVGDRFCIRSMHLRHVHPTLKFQHFHVLHFQAVQFISCAAFSAPPRRTVHMFHTCLSTALRNTFSQAVSICSISLQCTVPVFFFLALHYDMTHLWYPGSIFQHIVLLSILSFHISFSSFHIRFLSIFGLLMWRATFLHCTEG